MGETKIAVVSRITIARLHNCGNYEHVRYEIAVDVAPDGNPAAVLQELESILNDLKPTKTEFDYELRNARAKMALPASELTDIDFRNMALYRERVRKADEETANREAAMRKLNELGGSRVYTDAKNNWDDNDREYPI